MRIQEHDLYHGAALTQIVEHGSFAALSRDGGTRGLYRINNDRHLLIKYSSGFRTDHKYLFTFNDDQLQALDDCEKFSPGKVFAALVCGGTMICALSLRELGALVDLSGASQQWVTVECPQGKAMRTEGTRGRGPKVSQNTFPGKVLG